MKKFLEEIPANRAVNGSLVLLGLGLAFATLFSLSLQMRDFMVSVPAFSLPLMEQTVVAAQTATAVKARETAINSTAIAMNIPTISPTPGIKETQYAFLEATVRAESPAAQSSDIRQTAIARQLLLPTPTLDNKAVALEIERLAAGPGPTLGMVFWAMIMVLVFVVGLTVWLSVSLTSISSSLKLLGRKSDPVAVEQQAAPTDKNSSPKTSPRD